MRRFAQKPITRHLAAKVLFVLLLLNLSISIVLADGSTQFPTELTIGNGINREIPPKQQDTRIVKSGNNFIVVWGEGAAGTNYLVDHIRAQKFDVDGNPQWPAGNPIKSPVSISAGGSIYASEIYSVSDDSNGVIILWHDVSAGISATRLDSSGNTDSGWTAGGQQLISSINEFEGAVSDNNGGVTLIYSAISSGTAYLYMQRFNSDASQRWTSSTQVSTNAYWNGTAIITAVPDTGAPPEDQTAYITGYVGNVSHCYLRKITGTGTYPDVGSWISPIEYYSISIGTPEIRIASDGNGGIFAFYEPSSTPSTVSVAHYNDASVRTNIAIDPAGSMSFIPNEVRIISDGGTGAAIVYEASNISTTQVRTQHVLGDNTKKWNNGTSIILNTNTNGDFEMPIVTKDNNNNFFYHWLDGNEIMSQHVSNTGTAPYYTVDFSAHVLLTNVITNNDIWNSRYDSMTAVSDSNDLMMIWDSHYGDDDLGTTTGDNYLQKLTEGGTAEFTHQDATLTTRYGLNIQPYQDIPAEQKNEQIVRTTDGKYVIAWADNQLSPQLTLNSPFDAYDVTKIYAEKVDSSGNISWNPSHPGKGLHIPQDLSLQSQPYHELHLAADTSSSNTGGVLIAWDATADTNGTTNYIGITRLTSTGDRYSGWSIYGNYIWTSPHSGDPTYLKSILADSDGGAYLAWIDPNSGENDLYVAHVSGPDGIIDHSWNGGSPALLTTGADLTAPVKMVPDGSGNILVGYLSGAGPSLYVQKLFGTSGSWVWWTASNIDNGSGSNQLDMIADGSGGIIAAYGYNNGSDIDVKAQRLDSSGTSLWTTSINSLSGNQTNIKMVSDNAASPNGAIITWDSDYGPVQYVSAQRVDSGGNDLWSSGGVEISGSEDVSKYSPQIVSNGNNGAIISFISDRSGSPYYRLKAQDIGSDGTVLWQADGINVENSDRYNLNQQMAGDDSGSALITWEGADSLLRGDPVLPDIFAQGVSNTAGPVPDAVSDLNATAGDLQASLTWTAPNDNGFPISGYTIRYGTYTNCDPTTAPYTNCLSTTSATNSAVISNLGYSLDYIFAVYAQNTNGFSNASNTATATPTCSSVPDVFCAAQEISSSVLSFTNIPASFSFPGIVMSSSAQNVFNNSNQSLQPDSGDLLGVEDTRNSGGFEVQVQSSSTFSKGSPPEIPLSGLYISTSSSSPVNSIPSTDPGYTCPATDCGVIYGSSLTTRDISAPADNHDGGLGQPSTYTSNFGGGPVVLMDAGLPSSSGRDGHVYQYVNFYLNVPTFQPEGNYSVILTYTLLDSTT